MRAGYLQCDGCNCRTQTVEADDAAHAWPCCEHFPDGVPCRYAVIARCYSSVDIGTPNCITGTDRWPLFWPVTELKKKCYVGCEWVHRPTCATQGLDDYSGRLYDMVTDAINAPQAFPPAHVTGGVLGFHDGDYRSGEGGCIADQTDGLNDNWTLTITAPETVTLTLTEPAIVAWAAANSKTVPHYTNDADWDAFGRNQMTIETTGYASFPMLPKSICVVALDDPGASTNPCDTQEDRCNCCDFFGDSGYLDLNMSGCDGLAGVQHIAFTRVTSSPACGVSYPGTAPCKAFWGTTSTGAGCSSGGVAWSGGVGLLVWCDGDTYVGKAFCYSSDTSCWVEQGDLTISSVVCGCAGAPSFDVTLPSLACCCDDPGVTVTCCADTIPSSLTVSDGTDTYVITHSGGAWSITPTVGQHLAGCTFGAGSPTIALQCLFGTTWYFTIDNGSGTTVFCSPTGTCDPLDISCAITGCDAGTYTITITE